MKESQIAGGVVVNKKGQILVVSQEGPSWSLPKGYIDKGEDSITAAKREIYEESSITDLKLIKELGTYQRFRGGSDKSEIKIITMFLFKTNQEEIKPRDPDTPEAKWINKEDVIDQLTHQKDKEFFLSIINQI